MSSENPFSIMCFTWNAAGLKFCSTMFEHEKKKKGFFAKLTSGSECVTPNFFEDISQIIRERSPSLVAMATQDEDISDTYFHAEFLEAEMSRMSYSKLQREKLDGVGETASKNPYDSKLIPSGKPSGSALRLSIYARNDIFERLEIQERKILDFFSSHKIPRSFKCESKGTVAGALVTYVIDPTYGRFAFITAHLPLGTNASNYTSGKEYQPFRESVTSTNNFCLSQMKDKFLHNIPDPSMRPEHIILMGDLNYDIVPERSSVVNLEKVREWTRNIDASKIRQLHAMDELNFIKKEGGILEGFHEGIDNEGPWFIPTWRLNRNRPEPCSESGNVTSGTASKDLSSCFTKPNSDWGGFGWHDRILYWDVNKSKSHFETKCVMYNRIDVKNMHHSTHAGVIGLFEMKSI